ENYVYFYFQAEDGIRDRNVTGVQTCALPICAEKKPTEAGDTAPGGYGEPRADSATRGESEPRADSAKRGDDSTALFSGLTPGGERNFLDTLRGETIGGGDRKSTRLNSSHGSSS